MSDPVTGITAGSAVLGAVNSSNAANAQIDAANQANQLQQDQYNQTRADQAPYREAGYQALNKLIPLSDYTKFGMDQFQQDPGYAFRLAEGQKALDRQAAARGGLISGSALKAASRYGQEMGSQEYMNAFNRYQTERNAMLNPLQSLAGVGQTSNALLANAGQNYANTVGQNYMGAGNARASSYIGGQNSLVNAGNQYLNYGQNQQLINGLQNRGMGSMSNAGGLYGAPSNQLIGQSLSGGLDF